MGIVTCYPGSDVYELEGHSALRIYGQIGGRDVDMAVNYGLFDFAAPNFVYRFVKGETDYWCGASQWERFLYPYIRDGRKVVMHDVPLDSLQAARLIDIINDNLLPANSVYRYNYVKDNCATRPLRVVERSLCDSIILPEVLTDVSYRDVMRKYHEHYPWYQFGIDLALGSGIDYKLNARELAFAPAVLDIQLPKARVGMRKLVSDTHVINEGHDVVLGPTPWYATPLAIFWTLFAVVVAFTVRDIRRMRVTRWLDASLFAVFGIAGLVLTFLIFVSVHEATSPNWLYLWLNPLCLTVPLLIWLKKCKKIVISYHFINFALIFTMIVAWPLCGQSG
ncbi:MAG: DUF4105 domain-containing protein, partial [Muribaculaceae bacterium]|nr:DUF4105 domain-containing protein [Muribaculaceae bacterium]